PNLNPEIVKKIEESLCALSLSASLRENNTSNNPVNPVNPVQKLTPEDIFHYIYAVLHTPSYRSRYREFLKVDFPRIPYPSSAEEFRRLASIGEKLVAVHLLKDPKVRDMFSPYANFPVAGGNVVEFLATKNAEDAKVDGEDESLRSLRQKDNAFRVYINSTQYFDNVPETAWNFYVGGYQPAQKWLKDRKGRTLTSDDIMHYKAIVAALVETQRLMDEIEEGVKQ
ncbi:MAG: DNA methyltransferase, partial [Kiritimatiellae bacterium]|nr:DNA methyltransferase [Kiritimatiellia bacterium]